jgi:hypothetical protein
MEKRGTPAKKAVKKSAIMGAFVIGRARFSKISAVDGITLTREAKKRAVDFDRRGASGDERRRTIVRVYRKA